MSENFAAIDIGSNAIRYSVATFDQNGKYKVVFRKREPIRLGREAFHQRHLSDELVAQVVQLFESIKLELESYDVKTIRAVATSALRSVTNRKVICKKIYDNTGIVVHIIDGFHEAKMIYKAVRSHLDLSKFEKCLIMDLGGGSLELTTISNNTFIECHTFKLGTLRLLSKMENSPSEMFNFLNVKLKRVQLFLDSCFQGDLSNLTLIGTGGNPRRMGKLRENFLGKGENTLIERNEVHFLCEEMEKLSLEERTLVYNLKEDRADVIYPALLVFKKMIELTGGREVLLPKVGLIHGVFEDIIDFRGKN